jgi:septation ring formation regulator EzrA
MSHSERDPQVLIGQQLDKFVDAVATVGRISDSLIATSTGNARDIANLTAQQKEMAETLHYLEQILVRNGDASLITTVSKLKDAVTEMQESIEEVGERLQRREEKDLQARQERENIDRTGKWNLRGVLIAAIAAIISAFLGALLGHLWK